VPRQIRLNLNLQTAGRHDAAWKRLGDTRELVTDVDYYVNIARLAERGKLDAIFLADSHGSLRGESTRWADALFTGQRTKELAKRFTAQVKRLAAANGRDPDKLVVLPGLFVILGGTQAEAQRRKDELDALLDADYLLGQLAERLGIAPSALELDAELPYDRLAAGPGTSLLARHREQLVTEARERKLTVRQLLFNNLSGGHRVLIGTPEQVADDIIEWVDEGASDGFNVNIDVQTEGLEQFIDGVVAELQRRGRFRTEYEYETFRENLGVA
jgi:alkanesulfonate monooxygenase SsuD/methylene tetrahydromethanopterin reductase-like flavin-dependent oxidoreductase (luciferase family)